MSQVKIDIGADVGGALNGLAKVTKEMNLLGASIIKVNPALTTLQKQVTAFGGGVKSFASGFSSIPGAVNSAGSAISRFNRESNAAMQTTISFGRVIQDAPFGFLGIANNLNPLLESFQRLKAQTGSTGGALKELGKSLTGAGGIGLALSLVSSALILFGDKLVGTSRSIKDTELEATRFARSLRGIKDGIDALQNFVEFQASLDKLRLKLRFGDGFQANIGGLGIDLNKNKAIIDQNTELIARGIEKIARLEDDVNFFGGASAKALLKEFRGELDKIPDDLIEKLGRADRERLQQIKRFGTEKKALEDQRAVASEANSLLELQIQIEQNAELKRLQDQAKSDYDKFVSDTISRGKALAGFFSDIAIVPRFLSIDSTLTQFTKAKEIIQDFANANLTITFPVKVDEKSVEFPPDFKFPSATFVQMFGKDMQKAFEKFDPSIMEAIKEWAEEEKKKSELKRIGESLGNLIASGVSESLSGIGNALGAILSGSGIQSAFQAFAESIGSALQSIGKQLIAIGTAALLAKKSLEKLFSNPAVAIAAGIALVAAGGAMKNVLGRGLSGRATGGPVAGGTPYLIGERGPEVFVPSSSGSVVPNNRMSGLVGAAAQMINVVVTGRMQGNDLVLVQERVIRRNSRY